MSRLAAPVAHIRGGWFAIVATDSLRRRHRAQAHVRGDHDEPRGVWGAQTGEERPRPARQRLFLVVVPDLVAAESRKRRGPGAKELDKDGIPPSQRREVDHRYELALWPADDPFEPRGGLDAVVESHGAELDEPELGHRVAADPLQQVLNLVVCRLSAVDVQTVTYAHMRVTSRFLAQVLTAHGTPSRRGALLREPEKKSRKFCES